MEHTERKIRLLKVGHSQADFLPLLWKCGFETLQYNLLSDYLTGKRTGPKKEAVVAECDRILEEWEAQSKAAM